MNKQPVKAWICPMCGYIHYGDKPPDECPVCGAEGELFEPYFETVPAQAAVAPLQWRCRECGYIHDGSQPPDECPMCGAPASSFELVEESLPTPQAAASIRRVVIVGGGIAGVSAAESLHKAATQVEISLVSAEPHMPYYRLNLTRYLAGELTDQQLELHPPSWYEENCIHLLLATRVDSLDLVRKEVGLSNGRRLGFDRLVLTAGSSPFIPPIPGAKLVNVSTLRTREDAEKIRQAGSVSKQVICIGGGLLGLETAGALARQGANVTVLEAMEWLLPRQLNREAGKILEEQVRAMGIKLFSGVRIREIRVDGSVQSVLLEDGSQLPADLVVISAGIRPNLELAKRAGIETRQGILVDDTLQTSHRDVFAAGDIAEHRSSLYGTWGPAQMQGEIAGKNASGQCVEFHGIPRSNTLKVLGVPLFSIGRTTPEQEDLEVRAREEARYSSFLFQDNLLVGAVLLGDTSLSAAVRSAIETRHDFGRLLRRTVGTAEIIDHLRSMD